MISRHVSKEVRSESKEPGAADESRRAALKKLGLYGAYTAPALMVLLKSGEVRAQAVSLISR